MNKKSSKTVKFPEKTKSFEKKVVAKGSSQKRIIAKAMASRPIAPRSVSPAEQPAQARPDMPLAETPQPQQQMI